MFKRMGQIAVKFIYIIAIDNVVLGYIGYHVNIKIVICLIIGLAAFGCAGYFLIRS